MQAVFGSLYVNQFNEFGKSYDVIIQAHPAFRSNIEDFHTVYVPNREGRMVPISSLINITPVEGPNYLTRFDLMSSIQLTISPLSGVSSGDLIKTAESSAKESLSQGYTYQFSGEAYQEMEVDKEMISMFAFSLLEFGRASWREGV